MLLSVRPAGAADATALTHLLDAAYHGGYLATFDRDGPLNPRDLWWVHAEKDVSAIEVDRRLTGLLVVGRSLRQWLVEEILLEGFAGLPARMQEALITRVCAHLVQVFQRGRQQALLMRVAETNAFGLRLAASLRAALANALLVFRYQGPKRPAVRPPDGYEIRRARPDEAREVGRMVREVLTDRSRADEIQRLVAAKDGRAYLAHRGALLVGVAAAEVKPGRGDWVVGVRESHRRQGIGRALGASLIASLHGHGAAPYATAWALDPVAAPFLRALGFSVERTYLYLERPL
jgi:GNAT superfamily N-acetyltransferase